MSVDYGVTYNGKPSIKLAPHTSADVNYARECNAKFVACKPGDRVVFSAWVKTTSCSNTDPTKGARLGVDFYGNAGILDTQPHGFQQVNGVWVSKGNQHYIYPYWDDYSADKFVDAPVSQFLLPWNRGTWTYLNWDIIVPTMTYTHLTSGSPCTPEQVCGVIAWLDAREVTDNAYAYFADLQLYINP